MSTGLPRVGLLVCIGVFSACGGGRIEGGVASASSCGNGALDAGEACDDGDTVGGDGCAADCASIETGYTCPTPGADCLPAPAGAVCGNGVREGDEACDDGDTTGGDGCAADCATIEPGYACPPAGGDCTLTPGAVCGNGAREGGEACDDGDTTGGDGCAADCASIEPGYTCPLAGGECSVCGNGLRDGAEACDDGNTTGGDGCAPDCASIELGYTCPRDGERCLLSAACGNAQLDWGESCDDGNTKAGDGCAADCSAVDGGYACPTPGTACVQLDQCGNGIVDDNEICDPGVYAGVGCAADCSAVDPGWACPVPGEACIPIDVCGNGILEHGEACDDGDADGGDGCAADCLTIEDGWVCPAAGEPCVQANLCGNGVLESGEACDDGGTSGGDGCAADCSAIEAGWVCPAEGQACVQANVCGNGLLETGEGCDDGGVLSGDGCSSTCTVEPGFVCPAQGADCVLADWCGNGIVEAGEACDDGNRWSGDGCAADCLTVEIGHECPPDGGACVPVDVCGNGLVDSGEGCDDGNAWGGDGCSSSCTVESGYLCLTPGDPCVDPCGNGALDSLAGEECDDGNRQSYDGCSSGCTIEAGWACPTPGEACAQTCGDGNVDPGEECDFGTANNTGSYDPAAGKTCTPSCKWNAYCGDGNPDLGYEDCDLGTAGNTGAYGGCNADCTLAAYCGDGVKNGAEQCDAGTAGNTGAYGGCNADCTLAAYCGDGTTNGTEQCDAGTAGNTGAYNGCDADCTLAPRCGDKSPDQGEQCDLGGHCALGGLDCVVGIPACADGSACVSNNVGGYDGCTATCQKDQYCGDGVKNGGEECDYGVSGNDGSYGGCNGDCSLAAYCGDGTRDPLYEECDEGAANSNLYPVGGYPPNCQTNCRYGAYCGDGKVKNPPETCDDRNQTAGDGCSATCAIEAGFSCPTPGVACAPNCGNGRFDAGEACDDGKKCDDGASPCTSAADCTGIGDGTCLPRGGDGCTGCAGLDCPAVGCKVESGWWCPIAGACQTKCGNGVVDVDDGEECDDGEQCADGTTPCTSADQCTGIGDGTCQTRSGDGCTGFTGTQFDLGCKLEAGWECTPGLGCNLVCGNGEIDPGEECDDGTAANTGAYGGCNADCTRAPRCGDGYADLGHEQCDEGGLCAVSGLACALGSDPCADGSICVSQNTGEYDGCRATCTFGPRCGDGLVQTDQGETCDDGRLCPDGLTACATDADCGVVAGSCLPRSGDGCSDTCRLEAGYVCRTPGEACSVDVCGNRSIDPGEACDDGEQCPDGLTPCASDADCGGIVGSCLARSDDGCRSDCLAVEAGWDCSSVGVRCVAARCGDGIVADWEWCDDHNTTAGDGCSDTCTIEDGYSCPTAGTPCGDVALTCGNGILEPGEQCDDHNTAADDGCSASCQVEPGHACPTVGQLCHDTLCGDGFREGSEECDDRNTAADDGCSATCTVELGYSCPTAGEACVLVGATCGNRTIEPGEQCDDGKSCYDGTICSTDADCAAVTCTPGEKTIGCETSCRARGGDGCDPSCRIENIYACDPTGSCTPVCGDGITVAAAGEECDDGNTASGDGCSASCKIELGYTCTDFQLESPPVIDIPLTIRDVRGAGENVRDPADGYQYRSGDTYPCPVSDSRCYGHPDFESYGCDPETTGLVQGVLASDGKPRWTGYIYGAGGCGCPSGNPSACSTPTATPAQQMTGCLDGSVPSSTCPSTFDQWYHDTPDVNQSTTKTLPLINIGLNSVGQAVYQWDSQAYELDGTCADGSTLVNGTCTNMTYCSAGTTCGFYPIDNELYGNTPGQSHNYGFTSELHAFFEYKGGETLRFRGDDDVWVFINGKLALDLGGLHPKVEGSFTLSRQRTSYLGTCSAGDNVGQPCRADVDCPNPIAYTYSTCSPLVTACSGASADDMCPAGETCCRGGCVTGTNEGQACLANADCGLTDVCGTGTCLGGSNGGNPCSVDTDCPSGACGPGSCTLGRCAGPAVRDLRYDLYQGGIYELAMFHAERHTTASNYWLTLTGFVNTGRATCVPTCGDGLIRGDETCDGGDTAPGDGCDASCQIEGGWNCSGSPSVCFLPECGNGVREYPEECDDGNTAPGDGCGASCLLEQCGDASPDPYEECDAGGSNGNLDACTDACRQPTCGDKLVNRTGEECDPGGVCADGTACSVVENQAYGNCDDGSTCVPDPRSSTCTPECLTPTCGDGYVTAPEVCDDGANNGLYGHCAFDCMAVGPYCGDGALNGAAEQCDFGAANDDTLYNGCRTDCTFGPHCGDGVTTAPEQCDGQPDCNPDCTLVAVCGDTVVNPYVGEQCDLGGQCAESKLPCIIGGAACADGSACVSLNTGVYDPVPHTSCTSVCAWGPYCGDAVANGPESCDKGGVCGDGKPCLLGDTCGDGGECVTANVGGYAGCNGNCTLAAYCGDEITDAGYEECDQGWLDNGSYGGCNPDCTRANYCGDGVPDPQYEQCDLGGRCEGSELPCELEGTPCADGSACVSSNTGAYGGCNPDCTLPARCGDGIVQTDDGETCDDGILDGAYGGCTGTCQLAAECGDGNIDAAQGEQCDDGGLCGDLTTKCIVGGAPCADGSECVSQNDGRYEGCRSTCKLAPYCGDGLVDPAGGEACDETSLAGKSCTDLDGDGKSEPGDFSGGTLACTLECQLDTGACFRCGDGVKNLGEACDGGDLGGQTCDSLGFPDNGGLACKADCTFDLSGCDTTTCGNGLLDTGEQCDGTDIGSATCQALGYDGGVPTCNADCTLSLDSCEWCGDGIENGTEVCDGQDLGGETCTSQGFVSGQLACNSTCDGFDQSGCWECSTCGDCPSEQACVDHRCGACNTTADCCAPMVCFLGTCTLF